MEVEINSCSQPLRITLVDKQLGDGGDDGNEDPQYKLFLENLKEDGKSYALVVATNNSTSSSMKYEVEGSLDDEPERPTPRKSKKVPDTENLEATKDLRNLMSKYKMETQKNPMNVVSEDMMDSTKNMGNGVGKDTRKSEEEKDLKFEPVNYVSGETNGCSCQESSPKGNHLVEGECKCETEADMVDESYQIFLNGIEEEDECVVFANKDGKRVKYGGHDVASSSDFSKGNYIPFETSGLFDTFDDKQQCPGSLNTGSRSKFREKLMSKLREPYNHKEYEELWKIINERKPMDGRHRDLRGPAALKSYSKNECNRSYLERHSRLKKQINAVKCRYKVLNLLRGFFFWLENLAYEDAFLPWKDPSCLAVMP